MGSMQEFPSQNTLWYFSYVENVLYTAFIYTIFAHTATPTPTPTQISGIVLNNALRITLPQYTAENVRPVVITTAIVD